MMQHRKLRLVVAGLTWLAVAMSDESRAQNATQDTSPTGPSMEGSNETGAPPSLPGILVVPGMRPRDLQPLPDRQDAPRRGNSHGGCRYDGQQLDLIV